MNDKQQRHCSLLPQLCDVALVIVQSESGEGRGQFARHYAIVKAIVIERESCVV